MPSGSDMDTDALEDTVTTDSTTVGRVGAIRPRAALVVGAWLLLLIGVLVGMAVVRAPQMSPFDEGTHADYAYQVAHGHIPYAGSRGAQEIGREAACHGVLVRPLTPPPPCGTREVPSGYNYNFGHPPLYYAITGVIARAMDAAVPGGRFVTAARLVGIGWLWAAAMVLFLAIKAFGAPWPYAAAGATLLPLVPGLLYASSTVTNDAAAGLSGSLAVLVLARTLAQGRVGWVFPAVATLGVTATKVLNALPMLVAAVVLFVVAVIAWGRDRDRARAWSLLKVVAGIGVGFVLVYFGWTIFQAGRAVPGWVNPIAGISGRPVVGWPVNELLSTSFTGFGVVANYFLPPSIDGYTVLLWSRVLNVLVLAAPLVVLVTWPRRSACRTVGMVAFAGLASYPLVVEAQIYLSSRTYFPGLNSRYGLSLVPFVFACVAVIAWRRGAIRMLVATATVGGIAMIVAVGGVIN